MMWKFLIALGTSAVMLQASSVAGATTNKQAPNPLKWRNILAAQNAKIVDCDSLRNNVVAAVSADEIERGISNNGKIGISKLPPKDDYETSDKYEARIDKIGRDLFGQPDRVVFKTRVPDQMARYNADAGVLRVALSDRSDTMYINDPVNLALPLTTQTKNLGVRHGQTMMGVRFDYTAWSKLERKVVLTFPFVGSGITREVQIHVEPTAAKKLRENLRVVSFGTMAWPFMETLNSGSTASLDDPNDIEQKTDTYYSTAKCVYLVNGLTGEIYQSYKGATDSPY